MDISEYKVESGKGSIFNGQASSGKTHSLCKMVMQVDNPLILSFTKKAVENVENRLIKMGIDKDKAIKKYFRFLFL